ncbi:ABC transporter permease [Kitasatospora nipponensis]|uniref:ABC transporter permease n=1 Tax=Kitasatospora nipponensis TaxID=258049 RepID=A0ABP4H051_9ACTN
MTARTRMTALGRTEALLLGRNRTALFMAVAMPLSMIGALQALLQAQRKDMPGVDTSSALVLTLTATTLLFVVYYNLTAAYVARRAELVLKRLRTGELTDPEILGGTALPSAALALLQVTLITVGVAAVSGLRAPVNPLVALVGLLLALAMMIPLAALSSAFTRTVETTGITTLPVIMLALFGSGLFVPFSALPQQLVPFLKLLPTTSALALLRIGWLGGDGSDANAPHTLGDTWLPALPYLLGALCWLVPACWAARRWFRWEPRR